MTWSADGRLLLYGDWQTAGDVIAWNADDGSLAQTFRGHKVQPTHVAVSPDGKQVVACASDYSIRSWEFATGKPIATLTKLGSEAMCVAFSVDGRLIVSGAKDGALSAYDAATGQRLARTIAHEGPVNDVACSTTGLCASAGHDGTVRLWTLPTPPTSKDSANAD
jgi:WD40 repeat protein